MKRPLAALLLVSCLQISGGCALVPLGTGTTGSAPLKSARGFRQVGIASYYGFAYAMHRTASGERYNPYKMTAAHKTLPFATWVKVTNLENGRSVVVRINDRGPFVRGRIIDLSYAAAGKLGFRKKGIVRVRLEVLPREQAARDRPVRFKPEL